ncbi:class I SAM-dependent methyltransferase [Massilia sp. W12]|uniref:class I SAM-dependent methyltransferase n=1 Tax=Massilia sp. W12 TaxID=3126507 RepID=UPI0030D43F3D
MRRLADPNFINRYFKGHGLDIGGKPDPLSLYAELFCQVQSIRTWDWDDGDAQQLAGVQDAVYDFVHSSHCLEHIVDPIEGINNWLRVLKPDGYLIITVPDEDLYEQGVFPSTYNLDHKWTFTIFKHQSWSARSINLIEMVKTLGPAAELVRLEQLSSTYRFSLPRSDQTRTPIAECGIEMVIRKRPLHEIEAHGRWQRTAEQPPRELRIHLNQYKNDQMTLRKANVDNPPFTDEGDI